jgi:hypothetical protein
MLDRLRQPPAQNDHLTTSYYFLSVLYVNMIVAALAHFVFPSMEDGTFHYVSGMYTAALPLLPAGYGVYITLREIRKTRSHPPLEVAPAASRAPAVDIAASIAASEIRRMTARSSEIAALADALAADRCESRSVTRAIPRPKPRLAPTTTVVSLDRSLMIYFFLCPSTVSSPST